MSTEPATHPEPKNKLQAVLTYLAVAGAAFVVGMLLESQMAAQSAASVKMAHEQEMKQAADKAEQDKRAAAEEKRSLNDTLAKEREEHANDVHAKDRNLSVLGSRAAGVRRALEADLSAARSSGEACSSRIAGIAEAVGGVFESVGEVAGIAQDLGRENQQLKDDNKSLSEKLSGWQKWNSERLQRVTIVGKKAG